MKSLARKSATLRRRAGGGLAVLMISLEVPLAEGAAQGMGFIGMKALAGNYLAEEKSKPVNPVAAIKWVLKDPSICTIIPGYTTFDQIETDVERFSRWSTIFGFFDNMHDRLCHFDRYHRCSTLRCGQMHHAAPAAKRCLCCKCGRACHSA